MRNEAGPFIKHNLILNMKSLQIKVLGKGDCESLNILLNQSRIQNFRIRHAL